MLQIKEQGFKMTEANVMHIKSYVDRLYGRLDSLGLDRTAHVWVKKEGPEYAIAVEVDESLRAEDADRDFYKSVTKTFDKLERIVIEKHQKFKNQKRRKQRKSSMEDKMKNEIVDDDAELLN